MTLTSCDADSSTKNDTLRPSAAAIFISDAIVGVMPLFSILCTAAGEMPARCASCASDQPRSAALGRDLRAEAGNLALDLAERGGGFVGHADSSYLRSGGFQGSLGSSGGGVQPLRGHLQPRPSPAS